ncbi:MAG: UPF0057 membrane protein YqaE, partial [uncultured Chloroflexia bacterium]
GHFQTHHRCGSPPARRVFAGRFQWAVLLEHPPDVIGLLPGHHPRCLDHRQAV